jgi:hypothetical protein
MQLLRQGVLMLGSNACAPRQVVSTTQTLSTMLQMKQASWSGRRPCSPAQCAVFEEHPMLYLSTPLAQHVSYFVSTT